MKKLRAVKPTAAPLAKPKIGLFGASGVGKTMGAIGYPNAYLMDGEGGACQPHYLDKLNKTGGGYWGRADGAGDLREVVEEFRSLAAGGHPYKTAVLDSFSKVFNTAVADEAERLERAKQDNSFGKDKKPAVQLCKRLIGVFDNLDMNVVVICHEKAEWKNGAQTGFTYDGWDKLIYELNLMLRIVKEGGKRWAVVIKSRFDQFPEDSKFEWSYDNFADIYGRDILEGEVKATEFATDEQIQEYGHLVTVVKLPESTAAKWAETEVKDLTAADLQKRIDYLKNQLTTKGNQ